MMYKNMSVLVFVSVNMWRVHQYNIKSDWFLCLNGISTFVGYLMLKPSL